MNMLLKRCMDVHDLENATQLCFEFMGRNVSEYLLEIIFDGERHLGWGDDLVRGRDSQPFVDGDLARGRLYHASEELEECAFAGTILTHQSHLHPLADGEADCVEDGFVMPVVKTNLSELDDGFQRSLFYHTGGSICPLYGDYFKSSECQKNRDDLLSHERVIFLNC